MDMSSFVTESEKTAQAMGRTYTAPGQTACPYKEKIEDGKGNIDDIVAAFMAQGKKTLLVAPTSSGKTWSVNAAFKKINKEFGRKNVINILITPNRIQSTQNGEEYGIGAVVGGSHEILRQFPKENTFSCVADKAGDVLRLLPQGVHINLCIDEAHILLVEGAGYREEAINKLDELVGETLKRGGSVVYMTATPHSLCGQHFDDILWFSKPSYKAPAGHMEVELCSQEYNMANYLYHYLLIRINEGYIPFVRFNSKKATALICQKLAGQGIRALSVDAGDKNSTSFTDPATGKTDTIYQNIFYHGVVTRAELPAKTRDGQPVRAYFTTSMLETGTNITSVGGRQEEKLLPVFVCQDPANMSPTAAVQFFNRVRFHVEKYVFLAKDMEKDPYKRFRGFSDIAGAEARKAALDIPTFNALIMCLSQKYGGNQDQICRGVDAVLAAETVNGKGNDLGYLQYSKETGQVVINGHRFWEQVFSSWCVQFYYHHSELAEFFRRELKVQVFLPGDNHGGGKPQEPVGTDLDIPEGTSLGDLLEMDDAGYAALMQAPIKQPEAPIQQTAPTPITGEHLKTQLKLDSGVAGGIIMRAAADSTLVAQIKENKVQDVELRSAMFTREYMDMREMLMLGVDPQKAAKQAAAGNAVKISRTKFEALRDNVLSKFPAALYGMLEAVLCKGRSLINIPDPREQELVGSVAGSNIAPMLKKGLRLGIPMRTLMETAACAKKQSDISNFVRSWQYKTLNRHYLAGEYAYFSGAAGIEQFVVLSRLLAFNGNGNMIQYTVTDEVLISIADEINTRLAGIKNTHYTKRHVKNLIHLIFCTRDTAYGEQLASLRIG